jgi:ribokinase
VLLTPSPFSSSPLTAQEAAQYSEAARKVHVRNSPLPIELPEHLWQVDTLHLCPMRLETALTWINFLQDKPNIFVSADILPYPMQGNLDDPNLRKLLNRVDAFLPSEVEAESLMPGHNAETFCREIAARGPKIVGVKQGDHGVAIYDHARNLFRQLRPYPAAVDDLTGAGDSFCGGFAIGYARTGDAIQAALYGAVSASFIIEGFGGLHGLEVTQEQAQARLTKLAERNKKSLMKDWTKNPD